LGNLLWLGRGNFFRIASNLSRWQTRSKIFFLCTTILPRINATLFANLPPPFLDLLLRFFPWVCSKHEIIFCHNLIGMFTVTFAAYITASLAVHISTNSIWKFTEYLRYGCCTYCRAQHLHFFIVIAAHLPRAFPHLFPGLIQLVNLRTFSHVLLDLLPHLWFMKANCRDFAAILPRNCPSFATSLLRGCPNLP
jgi:hypothetical protein